MELGEAGEMAAVPLLGRLNASMAFQRHMFLSNGKAMRLDFFMAL
jgi:hypothetical protein